MSKYTTEVRFICEQKCLQEESLGKNSVNAVIANSWKKIFTTDCAFFDEEYRSVLCRKILKHYYTREIGFETVGLWELWMNRRLEEIMPYYNQLYKSAQLEFNPLYDVDYKREGNRANDGKAHGWGTTSNMSEQTANSETESINRNLFSETPQGALTGVENETYLTDARKITDNETNENSKNETASGSFDNENETNTTEEYIEHIFGKISGTSYSKMLNEYRTTLLNIDMLVIDEFNDLFMGLW